jgi:hypothetical protein
MSVRRDTAASSANTTNDYATINTDANGLLWVRCGSGCSGGVQYAEDAAHVSGDSVTVMGGIRRDTTPTSSAGTAGDYAVPNIDANGRLYTQSVLYDSTGVELTTSQDATHGSAVIATGPQPLLEAKDFDGSALPNTVSEGQAVRQAGSQYGIAYVMAVNENGSAIGDVSLAATATTTNTATPYTYQATASTNAQVAKAGAGNIYVLWPTNTTATTYYMRIFDTASTPTCSSSTGLKHVFPVLPTGGIVVPVAVGIGFSSGISFCVTGAADGTGNAAVGVFVNMDVK